MPRRVGVHGVPGRLDDHGPRPAPRLVHRAGRLSGSRPIRLGSPSASVRSARADERLPDDPGQYAGAEDPIDDDVGAVERPVQGEDLATQYGTDPGESPA